MMALLRLCRHALRLPPLLSRFLTTRYDVRVRAAEYYYAR